VLVDLRQQQQQQQRVGRNRTVRRMHGA
jgi:hypothetical protein